MKIGKKDKRIGDNLGGELEITKEAIQTTSVLIENLEALVLLVQQQEGQDDQQFVGKKERLVALVENLLGNQKIIRTKKAEWKNIRSMIIMVQ